jgi:hypothetical protein
VGVCRLPVSSAKLPNGFTRNLAVEYTVKVARNRRWFISGPTLHERRVELHEASVTRSALFWDFTQHGMVVPYRRFGATCLSHI